MKKKDLQQLRSKEREELAKMALDMRQEIISSRADLAAGKKINSKKVKNLRHDLAQILTLLREKEILRKMESEEDEAPEIQEKGKKE